MSTAGSSPQGGADDAGSWEASPSQDDTDAGWGERPRDDERDDAWFLAERPPHHDRP